MLAQWTLPQRKDMIKQLRDSGVRQYQYPLKFQGKDQIFDVYTVDIGFPCYRLGNGRTRPDQKELIAKNGFPADFFDADPDSEPALREQDKILRTMLDDAGLLKILKKNKQQEPLILDNEGYVVNGNRRLCAMRVLLEEDEHTYEHFKHVDVLFLPPCSDIEIKELEGRLQVLPQGRAEYSWVVEAMLFRDLRILSWDDDKIADLYEMRPSDVRDRMAMLEDAESYLADRGKSGQYSFVRKHKFAFEQLNKIRKKCGDDEPKKQLVWTVSYIMLDDPDTEGRLYENIPDAFKYIDKIAKRIQDEFKDQIPTEKNSSAGLDILGDGIATDNAEVIKVLKKSGNETQARLVIRDTIEELRSDEREKKDAQYCCKQIQQAYTRLQSALSALDTGATLDGIEATLTNIEYAVKDIRTWLAANVETQN